MQTIFIHGLGQNASSWNRTLPLLAEPVHAACPDLAAMLKSGGADYASLYHAFSDYCGNFPEPLNLCGLSLGGILALQYAIEHPDRVQSLTLIGAQYKMPKKLLRLQSLIFGVMPKSAFENTGFQKETFIQLTNSMTELDFSERLRELSCAVLILCGEKDSANIKAAKTLAECIPGARLTVLAGTGHEANIENPEALASELNTFLLPLSKENRV